MMKKLLLAALISLFPIVASGSELYAYRDSVKNGYDFAIYLPDSYAEGKTDLPVVLFLHGTSLNGTELENVLQYGPLDAVRKGVDINAIIVAPQTQHAPWYPERLCKVLDFVASRFACDMDRMYVLGMSQGGWGTLRMAQFHPERVAAAMAICGGYSERSVDGLLQVPLWIIHGIDDETIPFTYSNKLVNRMEATGKASRLMYDWVSGYGHGGLARLFYMKETYEWLFSHSLKDENREVDRSIQITYDMMERAFRGVASKPYGPELVPAPKGR